MSWAKKIKNKGFLIRNIMRYSGLWAIYSIIKLEKKQVLWGAIGAQRVDCFREKTDELIKIAKRLEMKYL